MKHVRCGLLMLLLGWCAWPLTAQPWNQAALLMNAEAEEDDDFGVSVSISGDRAIVGARNDDTAAPSAGAAFVYERDGTGAWVEVAKLTAGDAEGLDNFGVSVSISGDRVVVGAPGEDTGGARAGAAYVFERDGTGAWVEVAKLTAGDTEAHDEFGVSVSISGDRVIVGAPGEDTGGSLAGAAYVYERDGTGAWVEVAKLTAGDAEAEDHFGFSVSVSGDRAIVGANWEGTGGRRAGAAYVFERDGTGAWVEVAKLTAGDTEANDEFGFSVSISGDRAIVGAIDQDVEFDQNAGAAYVFERDGTGAWVEVARLLAGDVDSNAEFGYSVAVSGDRAIVGAWQEDLAGMDHGAAYVFVRDATGTWSQEAKLIASDTQPEDQFGVSVSISGGRAIVGANREASGREDGGSAYIFERETSVGRETLPLPEAYVLEQNHPNPFRLQTRIVFTLPEAAMVRLTVYDVLGRAVARPAAGRYPAGTHAVTWDGRSEAGVPVPGGVYVYRLEGGSSVQARRMVRLH
ncbi:MAG: hypothetical protein KatS3mg043_1591 [Rhodothermaceae bacterium]|nr:MAG: hypothetical protein KatS3mg043_1591 [Rhodothermaceae bacterium]